MEVRKSGHLAFVGSQHIEYDYKASEVIVPFGAGVMRGTDKETQCKLMATGGKFLGVAKAYQRNSYDKAEYPNQTTVEIITKGKIWVQVATSVSAGDKAACGNSGKFAISGTATYDDIDGIFETSASADGYAILNLK